MSKRRILIIEDEKDMVYGLEFQLKANEFDVFVAYDGQQGIEKAVEDKPDLILLDIMLPKRNGFEVCKTLKSDQKTKNIPIVILSVRYQEEDKQQAFEYGANYYFTKPFDADELADKINELLNTQ